MQRMKTLKSNVLHVMNSLSAEAEFSVYSFKTHLTAYNVWLYHFTCNVLVSLGNVVFIHFFTVIIINYNVSNDTVMSLSLLHAEFT